jgi:hypothetical protein
MIKKIVQNKRDIIFAAVGLGLLILFIVYIVSSISFLLKQLSRAYNPDLIKSVKIDTFNVNALKSLKIIKAKEALIR